MKSHHPFTWPESHLDQCWTIEVERNDEPIAYVWFHEIHDKVIECHAVAHPDSRGRWLTRELFAMIKDTIINETDCTACVAQIHHPSIARMWGRLGFVVYPHFAILKVKDVDDGRTVRITTDADNSSPDQGS